MRAIIFTLSLAALLGGCTHHPAQINVSSTGGAPRTASYRFAPPAPGVAPPDKFIHSQVERSLTGMGFRSDGDNPQYIVEIGVSSRPVGMGVYAGSATLAPPKGGNVCEVSLRFTDVATGTEAYHVRVAQSGSPPDCNTENFHLSDLATGDLSRKLR